MKSFISICVLTLFIAAQAMAADVTSVQFKLKASNASSSATCAITFEPSLGLGTLDCQGAERLVLKDIPIKLTQEDKGRIYDRVEFLKVQDGLTFVDFLAKRGQISKPSMPSDKVTNVTFTVVSKRVWEFIIGPTPVGYLYKRWAELTIKGCGCNGAPAEITQKLEIKRVKIK
jgi:hypothetical protein